MINGISQSNNDVDFTKNDVIYEGERFYDVRPTVLEVGKDVRHINEYIDAGHPDVKEYIENLEDHITYLYHQLLQYEPENETILHTIGLDDERNARVRNPNENEDREVSTFEIKTK